MIRIMRYPGVGTEDLGRQAGSGISEEVDRAVAEIIENVRLRGDAAVMDYTERFDGVRPDFLMVTPEERGEGLRAVNPGLMSVMREAAENIRRYHESQKREGLMISDRPGVLLGQRVTPIERVGIYIPGGTASYPSTVLMDVIPAKVAGVRQIVLCTPPGRDGKLAPAVLAAAEIAGVSEIYKVGGAQAIAALAYGTAAIPRVDKIVGPGNIYVAAAKRRVFGVVGIDTIAGPSDILVLADNSSPVSCIAADMLSQAEHDALSRAVLVCASMEMALAVSREISRRLDTLPRKEIAKAAIDGGSVIIVAETLEKRAEIVNKLAPEHLEILTADPFAALGLIKNAGSIFLGPHTPEAVGDYFAGVNHTLPTLGAARFSGPLSVDDFVKKSSVTYYGGEALERDYRKIAEFARAEGLEAHARSVETRFDEKWG